MTKVKEQVQTLYNQRASLYERLFVRFLGWGRELERFFQRTDYVHPNMRVLDAGCGTGIVTRILHQLAQKKSYEGIQFCAFDLTQNMLDIFQQWAEVMGASNIEIRQADVLENETLPAHWKEFDLIISSTMLEYIPEDKVHLALENLKQLLKHEGKLLVFLTRRNVITRILAGLWWKTNTFERADIQARLHQAGFNEIVFKEFSHQWSNSIMVIEAKV